MRPFVFWSGLRLMTSSRGHWRSISSSLPVFSLADEKSQQFGFEKVTPDQKQEKVTDVFNKVAANYDLMNDVMSFGIHRCWKNIFIRKLNPLRGTKLLDVAGGTGDVAFRFIDECNKRDDLESTVTVCDINTNMINVGQKRCENLGPGYSTRTSWVTGDAQQLPFDSSSFDVYTIAYGIRNVVHIDQALDEAFRVLKPGGMFLCLEFSKVQNPLLSSLYKWYSFQVIPVLGEIIAQDWKSYKYLVESIRQFPDQMDFKQLITDSGFTLVECDNLMQGISTIYCAYKPS